MADIIPAAAGQSPQPTSIPLTQFDQVIAEFLRCGELEESMSFGEPHILLAIPNTADSKNRGSYMSPHGIKFFEEGKQIYHEIIMSGLQPAVAERVSPLIDPNMHFFKTFNFKLSLDGKRIMPRVLGYYAWKSTNEEGGDGEEEGEMTAERVDQLNALFPLLGLRLLIQSLPQESFPGGYVDAVAAGNLS